MFAIAVLEIKLGSHTEICEYFKLIILNYSIFGRVKDLSKSDQTWYEVSHLCLES